MPNLKNFVKKVEVFDVDIPNKKMFDLEMYRTDEQSVIGYIALRGKTELCRKFYMEHVTMLEVKANFKKYFRENRITF